MKRLIRTLQFVAFSLLSFFVFSSQAFSSVQAKSDSLQQVVITFRVDMTQWTAKGSFNPATDSLDLPGTFNNWAGSSTMTQVSGLPLVYELSVALDSLSIVQFKFRINHDSTRTESLSTGANRMFRVPGHPMTTKYMFSDYDTSTVPVTFKCHMGYQVRESRFSTATDYLDIAGNMNNNGNYDLLFPVANDTISGKVTFSVYSITMNISRDAISTQVLTTFKFRINGSWLTAELPNGAAFRTYQIADTTGGNKNIIEVWYDNQNPAIPSAPFAYNVIIQGDLVSGKPLSGAYSYEDVNGDKEGLSHYQWYHADDLNGTNIAPIIGATNIGYNPSDTVVGKYLVFEITPVAKTGAILTGEPVRVYTVAKVGGVGINDLTNLNVRIYPNPATDQLNMDLGNRVEKIGIYTMTGQILSTSDVKGFDKNTINTSTLHPGIYIIKFMTGERSATSTFIIK